MTKKPLFHLIRTTELGHLFGRLGRTLKAGDGSESDRRRYTELGKWMRDGESARRYHRWWSVYEEEYRKALDSNLSDGMTHKAAHRSANSRALEAVCTAFPEEVTTTRGVSKGLFGK